MAKYIDADRLKKELQKRFYTCVKVSQDESNALDFTDWYRGKATAYSECLSFINSFQQEQESVVERFARIVRENLTGIDKEVQQKFEQLYFEVTGNKMYGGYND